MLKEQVTSEDKKRVLQQKLECFVESMLRIDDSIICVVQMVLCNGELENVRQCGAFTIIVGKLRWDEEELGKLREE